MVRVHPGVLNAPVSQRQRERLQNPLSGSSTLLGSRMSVCWNVYRSSSEGDAPCGRESSSLSTDTRFRWCRGEGTNIPQRGVTVRVGMHESSKLRLFPCCIDHAWCATSGGMHRNKGACHIGEMGDTLCRERSARRGVMVQIRHVAVDRNGGFIAITPFFIFQN